jgi:hippurate hydrolase
MEKGQHGRVGRRRKRDTLIRFRNPQMRPAARSMFCRAATGASRRRLSTSHNLVPEIVASHAEFTELRRDLHAHPELGFEEERTAGKVAALLRAWGVDEVEEAVGIRGVVGTIVGREYDECVVGFRADMDALPIVEETGLPHASTNAGIMHACGHDGHTATLLCAAKYLASTRRFRGRVRLIFQPNEEGVHYPDGVDPRDGSGADRMLADGLFERWPCDRVFGLHNWPGMPLGSVGVRAGPLMGSEDNFRIVVRGRGGHAAMPHRTIDPTLAVCSLVVSLQSLVARSADPDDGAVVSATQVSAPALGLGTGAYNVVPDAAEVRGTVRCFRPDTRALLRARLREVAEHSARTFGAEAEVTVMEGFPSTINDADAAQAAREAAESVVGKERVVEPTPTPASEDFAAMLQRVPGAYVWVGADGPDAPSAPLHHPRYDFNDDVIPVGASLFVRLAERLQPLRA